MSLDNSLRAIAYAEAPTLGLALAQIAKHRIEVDAALRAAQLQQAPVTSQEAAEIRAVGKVAEASEAHLLDRFA